MIKTSISLRGINDGEDNTSAAAESDPFSGTFGGGIDENVYLVEDALTLWLTLIRIAPSYNASLHSLFPRVTSLICNHDWEHLKVCMHIIEAYIVVGGEMFLNQYAGEVSITFVKTIGQVKAKACSYIMLPLLALVRMFPVEGGKLLVEGGGMNCILKCVLDVIREQRDCESDLAIVQWMSVLARTLLAVPSAIDSILDGQWNVIVRSKNGEVEGFSGKELLELFFDKFDQCGHGRCPNGGTRRRKLWALALCCLLPGGNHGLSPHHTLSNGILQFVDRLVDICVDVMNDENDAKEQAQASSNNGTPRSSFDHFDDSYDDYDSEEDVIFDTTIATALYNIRMNEMDTRDEVCKLDFKVFVKGKMDAAADVVGSVRWNEIMEGCEPTTRHRLISALTMYVVKREGLESQGW